MSTSRRGLSSVSRSDTDTPFDGVARPDRRRIESLRLREV
jgi:hypothetical protein